MKGLSQVRQYVIKDWPGDLVVYLLSTGARGLEDTALIINHLSSLQSICSYLGIAFWQKAGGAFSLSDRST